MRATCRYYLCPLQPIDGIAVFCIVPAECPYRLVSACFHTQATVGTAQMQGMTFCPRFAPLGTYALVCMTIRFPSSKVSCAVHANMCSNLPTCISLQLLLPYSPPFTRLSRYCSPVFHPSGVGRNLWRAQCFAQVAATRAKDSAIRVSNCAAG